MESSTWYSNGSFIPTEYVNEAKNLRLDRAWAIGENLLLLFW